MPATKKITKQHILDAAMQVFRRDGFDAVNARNIASEMNCSTQPIYGEFKSMDEVKHEIDLKAREIHNDLIKQSLNQKIGLSYQAYGVGLVTFAMQEKMLFRYLFLDGGDKGNEIDNEHFNEIITVIQKEWGYPKEIAIEFHRDMSVYSFGLAMMVNAGYQALEDKEIRDRLDREFTALTSIYGLPVTHIRYNL